MPFVQLRRAAPEHLLDRGPQLVRTRFAALEVGNGLSELLCAQLDLVALRRERTLDPDVSDGRVKQAAERSADALLGPAVLRPALPLPISPQLRHHPCSRRIDLEADGPDLSRRIWTGPAGA